MVPPNEAEPRSEDVSEPPAVSEPSRCATTARSPCRMAIIAVRGVLSGTSTKATLAAS